MVNRVRIAQYYVMNLVILFDILLAIIILIVATSLGRVFMQYKSEYQPIASLFEAENSIGFNAIVRIFIAPIGIVVASILLYSLKFDQAVRNIWMVSVCYFMLQSLLLIALGRWMLVSKGKFLTFHLISVLLSYYLYVALIVKGLEHLLPDEANLRTDLWLLIVGFFYGMFRAIPENAGIFVRRKNKYISSKSKRFKEKYKSSFKDYGPLFLDILLAIMIYEDFNRPKLARMAEWFFRSKTRGIMQVKGAKTDEDSITLAAKLLRQDFSVIERTKEGSSERYTVLYSLFTSYNPKNAQYPSEVMTIDQNLRNQP